MSALKKIAVFSGFLIFVVIMVYGSSLAKKAPEQTVGMGKTILENQKGRPLFFEFYSDGCSICQVMEPDLKKLEAKYGDSIYFVKVNVDDPQAQDLVMEFGVQGLPSFFWLTSELDLYDAAEGMLSIDSIEMVLKSLVNFPEEENKEIEPENPVD
ncbi:MAG TPA: thioredoxin domain-containing protein [bacterium]|nr:thioredoxin domain-containing protein [bacterium]